VSLIAWLAQIVVKEGLMKTYIAIVAAVLTVTGCGTPQPSSGNPALKSEREYAESSEARAQNLYRTGQASSISEARARAAGDAHNEWAAAAKATQRKQRQEKFEKDLSEMDHNEK
jgi:hypothetical protein